MVLGMSTEALSLAASTAWVHDVWHIATASRPRDQLAKVVASQCNDGRIAIVWFSRLDDGRWRRIGMPLVVGRDDHAADFARNLSPPSDLPDLVVHDSGGYCTVYCRRGEIAVAVRGTRADALDLATIARVALEVHQVTEEPKIAAVSRSQQKVLDLLLCGFSENEIARHLSLSPGSVHGRIRRIYERHGVTSRPRLMAKLMRPVSAAAEGG